MVEALRGQMRLLRHARDHGWDSVWGAQHFLPTMAMTQPVPFLARLAAEAGEMRVGLAILLLALANPLEVAEADPKEKSGTRGASLLVTWGQLRERWAQ